jgi:hypothetical protein
MSTLIDVFEKRHTTFAWDEERIPERELILEALREVHNHIPSKNLQFPYQVRLMRNDDPAIRKQIMHICRRRPDLTEEQDPGNPQVLAPWLIGFNARYVADLEVRYEKTSKRGIYDGEGKGNLRTNDDHGAQTQTENIEIGIFSAYIMLALANKGIQTGMCANICMNYEEATEIFKLEENEKALDFRFIMGIGYGKDIETRHDYLDPRVSIDKPIPFAPVTVEEVYPRPAFDDIIIQL